MNVFKKNKGLFLAAAATAILAGCVSGREGAPTDFFYNFDLTSPRGNLVTVCSGYGCRFETKVMIDDHDLDQIRSIFAQVEDSETGEREAVQSAIAYLETRVGTEVGTSEDRGKIEARGVGDKTQQDCIDESTNTTSYLIVMEANGFLKYHKVRRPEVRGYWLDGRWPHWTAVLQSNKAGSEWAIDSWWRDNGAEPVVIPLADWYEFDEQREDIDVPFPGITPSGSRQS